jgi:hypothetical protein
VPSVSESESEDSSLLWPDDELSSSGGPPAMTPMASTVQSTWPTGPQTDVGVGG